MISTSKISKGRFTAPFLVCAALSLSVLQGRADDSFRLATPVDCVLGETCYIQQYVDRDPGPEGLDFACGRLANDGHRGTDFAVPTEADMRRGVPVVAAATGLVLATRDGMPDIRYTEAMAPDIAGEECGNGIVLDHGGGWQTQYCHLRDGTVDVKPGDTLRVGEQLGLIGMSGLATFPHIHFSVRHDGKVVDPFQPDSAAACGAPAAALWDEPITYDAGGPIAAGLADAPPDYDAVKAGLAPDGLSDTSDAVVLWVLLSNVQAGDEIVFAIDGPTGPFQEHRATLDRAQPLRMQIAGRRAPSGGLEQGRWSGVVRHLRDGDELGSRDVSAMLP